ncbi:MAG: CmcJ/NvfI family oxidoreductase [Novosphingobium sp.]|nr:hypothetical protein [Novosphingobium sp.]
MSGNVDTHVHYLDDPYRFDDERPLHYFADFTKTTNARLAPHPVQVRDGRGEVERLSLDREGFTIVRWPTKITDFIETRAIEPEYIAECEDLIRKLTGAVATWSAGPIHCRFDGVSDPKERYDGKPAHYVHADYSDASAAQTIEHICGEPSRYARFAIYNIWRVTTPPPQSRPLGVCDASSIGGAEEYESGVTLSYPDGTDVDFLTTLYRPRAEHRWYYFSDMTPDEVLVFKSHDTDVSRAGRVPHCAFADSNVTSGAVRMSIEARILAAFEERAA